MIASPSAMRRRRQVPCGTPLRGPDETSGSMPTYSDPAAIAAPIIAATMSFSLAPVRTTSIPARMPAST